MNSAQVVMHFKALADPTIAKHSQRFFKTAEGQYGHGDVFWGLRVPTLRQAVKPCKNLCLQDVKTLLTSEVHELRLFALLLLVEQYKHGSLQQQQDIFDVYLQHTRFINNWDLVDSSASPIIGAHLASQNRNILYQLAGSSLLWERRIAIMATLHFIRNDDFSDTLKIAKVLVLDEHDLIHKAVGWMLREVGNRSKVIERHFLLEHYNVMPRTMLRYAIEKFPEIERQQFLKGKAA
jgi:3-methyladenine DNA glycosylase AlkD